MTASNDEKLVAYTRNRNLFAIFSVIQVLCLVVWAAPLYVPIITKAYFGDVVVAVYRYYALELGVFLVSSVLALFFRYRARILRIELEAK